MKQLGIDLQAVLKAMGDNRLKNDPLALRDLKETIDEAVAYTVQARASDAQHLPHLRVRAFKALRAAIERVHAAAKNCGLSLVDEADLNRVHPLARPSAGAWERIAKHLDSMTDFGRLAAAGEARAQRETKTNARVVDYSRWRLVLMLGHAYQRSFQTLPKATEGGPWCIFLAEVLTRCEGQEVSIQAAHGLWLKVKKWQETIWRDAPEIPKRSVPDGSGPFRFGRLSAEKK